MKRNDNNDKTKSNENFIISNISFPEQINKIKYYQGYGGIKYPLLKPINKMNILQQQQLEKKKLNSDLNCLPISIIMSVIIIFALISFLLVYFLKIKEKNLSSKDNFIQATYKCKKGENLSFVKDFYDKYIINYTKVLNDGLRHISEQKINRIYKTDTDESITIRIFFNRSLSNFSNMFEGCQELINVSLSNINYSKIKSMSNTFKDCSNLEIVNLTSFDASKVTSMNNLFNGCKNLISINGLEKLNTSRLKNINEMFVDCEKLTLVNLSSFNLDNIKEKKNIFDNNPSLKYIDLRNSNNINISEMFNTNYFENKSISIIINEESKNNNNFDWIDYKLEEECYIGDNEKCKSCRINSVMCNDCNEGYYLPDDDRFSKTECIKCEEGCAKCTGDGYHESSCTDCMKGYININKICEKNEEIETSFIPSSIIQSTLIPSSQVTSTIISSSEINDTLISSSEINSTTISSTEINDTLISSSEINSTTISYTDINDTLISSSEINSTTISSPDINDTSEINSTTISSPDINDTLISSSEINSTTISSSQIQSTPIKNDNNSITNSTDF